MTPSCAQRKVQEHASREVAGSVAFAVDPYRLPPRCD
jgi:hypothetical protein